MEELARNTEESTHINRNHTTPESVKGAEELEDVKEVILLLRSIFYVNGLFRCRISNIFGS